MKDDNIKSKVIKLKDLVKEVNELMTDLGTLNVDVKIGYVEKKATYPNAFIFGGSKSITIT